LRVLRKFLVLKSIKGFGSFDEFFHPPVTGSFRIEFHGPGALRGEAFLAARERSGRRVP
jgi:hypothetical protein